MITTNPFSEPKRISPPPSPLLYLACLVAGIQANQLPFSLFFNIDLLFGSIFALLALRLFGLPQGITAAALIALPTYFLWHHPFAVLIMTAEACAVGSLHRRYNLSLIHADTLYWLFIGMPLVYCFYGQVMEASSSTAIIMIKQAINGIANALIADLLFSGWLMKFRTDKLMLREMPANLLAAFALLPTLILFMFTARQDYAAVEAMAHAEVISHSRQMKQALEGWLKDRENTLTSDPEQLKKMVPSLATFCPQDLFFTLIDQNNRVLLTNRLHVPPMAAYQRPPGHIERPTNEIMLWVPQINANRPYSERWHSALFINSQPIDFTSGWTLLLEKPMGGLQRQLSYKYRTKFTFLFAVVLLCLTGSTLINRKIAATMAQLNSWTEELSQHIPRDQPDRAVPESRWLEVSTFIDQFALMERELKEHFATVQQMNLLLEQKVDERTRSLQTSRDLLQHITDAIPVGIFQADTQGNILFFNNKLCELCGLHSQDYLGVGWMSALHPEDRERIHASWTGHIRAADSTFSEEFRFLTPGGNIHWVCGIARRIALPHEEPPLYIGCVVDLTERKSSEMALREHSDNLGNLIETTNDMVVVTNRTGNILFSNQAVHMALEYSQEHLRTLMLSDLYTPENNVQVNLEMERLDRGEQVANRIPLKTSAGTPYPVSARISQGTWNGDACHFLFFKDLSREKEARRLFQRLFQNNPTLMALTSLPDRYLVDVNASFERTLGYSREEVLGKTALELGLFVFPEQRQAALQLLHGQESLNGMVMQIRCKNGVVVDGLFSGEKIVSEGREYWLSVMVDITPWKLAQEALQRRESYLTALIESQPGLVWLKDEASRFLTVNSAFAHACGKKSPKQVAGKCDMDLWPKDLAVGYREDDVRVMESGQSLMVEEAIADKGVIKWFETFKTPVFGPLGQVIGTAGYARDITERRQAEKELRESRERLLTATSAAQLGVYSYDFTTTEMYFSPQFLAHYGLGPDATLPLDTDLVPLAIHPDDKGEFLTCMLAANTPGGDGIFEHEYRIVRPDGAIRWLRVVGRTIFSPKEQNSRPLRASGIVQDLSERKKMEQALRTTQAEALAANAEKTTLLSTVAHEFRTPLSLMSSSLDILERYDARLSDEQRRTQKQYLRNAVHQLKHLVDSTLAFNRSGVLSTAVTSKTVDIAPLCATIGQEIELVWSRKHDFLMDISPKVGSMRIDVALFRRIVENLLTNAFLYTPEGGQIRFLAATRNRTLYLEVADQGVGIADEDVPHIFHPFYRGGNVGSARGMGLGLNIVQTTVRRLGGQISMTSQLHRGTTFRVELPLATRTNADT